jgi:hypothetical protein
LQPVQPTHLAEVHRGLSNPTVTRYLLIHFPTLESTHEQMAFYETLWAKRASRCSAWLY